MRDWREEDFSLCMQKIQDADIEEDLSPYQYSVIFDPKALKILESDDFSVKAEEFNRRYQELFEQEGSIYQKGVFNPNRAETSFKTLGKQGFFAGGHRVHLKGDDTSINEEELVEKLKLLNASIDGDVTLKKIKDGLAKNAQTEALAGLIEVLSPSQFEYLLEHIKPASQSLFRKQLWIHYLKNTEEAVPFIEAFKGSKEEIEQIEREAAQSAPRWEKAVERFNDRFVDMPFKLTIPNQAQAVLGRQTAILNFVFKDDPNDILRTRENVRTSLSQGERRALYLLNFIFDVEARKLDNQETLFILDDVADSFDYKNKHAIIQYLRDLTDVDFFHQIILTHNFDFFRALSKGNGGFVHRQRCLMTDRIEQEITLPEAIGVSNYFLNVWKPKIMRSERVLYATIPFTRNLIEYTIPDYKNDTSYKVLTSLLHWKQDTDGISVGEYLKIYNIVFNTSHLETDSKTLTSVLFNEAQAICEQVTRTGLDLEDKVLLSIAIRIKAEKYLTEKIRNITGQEDFWYQGSSNQFKELLEQLKGLVQETEDIRVLEKVGITVNSNIHLNSFMYEPILDLTIEHLIALYREVDSLNV